jgi:hypothetical protein
MVGSLGVLIVAWVTPSDFLTYNSLGPNAKSNANYVTVGLAYRHQSFHHAFQQQHNYHTSEPSDPSIDQSNLGPGVLWGWRLFG